MNRTEIFIRTVMSNYVPSVHFRWPEGLLSDMITTQPIVLGHALLSLKDNMPNSNIKSDFVFDVGVSMAMDEDFQDKIYDLMSQKSD